MRAQRLLTWGLATALIATLVAGRPTETRAAMVGQPVSPGQALAWGDDAIGQLGDNNRTASSTPSPLYGRTDNITAIAGGESHSLGLTAAGSVLAWGANSYGQLGNSDATFNVAPAQVVGLTSGQTAIAAGAGHSLALGPGGSVFTWGANSSGQLGNGGTSFGEAAAATATGLAGGATAIAGGSLHSLALKSDGSVWAWGDNSYGQLGTGAASTTGCKCVATPAPVTGLTGGVTAIAAGGRHSLALKADGSVWAWGFNLDGELGNGATSTSNCQCIATPAQVSGLTGGVTAIAGGYSHSLALRSDGSAVAWGANGSGQLGNGTGVLSATPAQVTGLTGGVTAIAAGQYHSLALRSNRSAVAWGSNVFGQLGDGTTTDRPAPVPVTGLARGTTAIAGGYRHSLAIQFPVVAVLPAMSNGAYGGFVTAITIQNTGPDPAALFISYFDQNGAPAGPGDAIDNLPANAGWTVRQDNGHAFPGTGGNAFQAGSAIVYSSGPIASLVNEFPPGGAGDATSYSGIQVPSEVGTTLYAPAIGHNAFGGYTTGIGLVNEGNRPTDVTVTYRDAGGTTIQSETSGSLAAHAYLAAYSGNPVLSLPDGFAGTATITNSASQPLGAVVNETGPGGQISSYDALPSVSALLNVPVALNNAFGGYNTGMGIQNTSPSAGGVTVTYHDAIGNATARSFSIPGNGALNVYQGSPDTGPAPGAYTAMIQSSTPLAAIVNEVAPAGAGTARQSTAYNAALTGSGVLHLPLVENAGSDLWNTGEGIMNTGATTTVTVTYHDSGSGATIGTPQTQTLPPQAFWGLYQPGGGLPAGTRATAVVTTASGGQVAVICNESNATTFMSYSAQ